MARITVEDCFKKLKNKFELAILSSYRAKEISKGAETEIGRRNDKNSVIALREIASEHTDVPKLRQAYVRSLQLCIVNDDVAEEENKKVDEKTQNDELQDALSSSDDLIESEFISVDGEEDSSIEGLEIDAIADHVSEEDKKSDSNNSTKQISVSGLIKKVPKAT